MKNLFAPLPPLAERLRPQRLSEFVGQKHLLGEGKFLSRLIAQKRLPSLLFWGPPGCGKTTLAHLLTKACGARLISISAVEAGIKDLRQAIDLAQKNNPLGQRTVILIDEIHRFNKSQQDFLLPFVEKGIITLIGITTENPSFRLVAPLLSRLRVLVLKPLSEEELLILLKRALSDPRGYGGKVEVEEEVLGYLAQSAQGDARGALNLLEAIVDSFSAEKTNASARITLEDLSSFSFQRPLLYDRAGEEHYNLLSAYHKSLRGSDPDAAVYWMVRMLEAGEDPLVIVRRLIAAAAEDVGNADPQALLVAVAAKEALEFLGLPEGELALAQATIYVACAPKSNACYRALEAAREDVRRYGALPVPLHLRNPETKLMKELGYGKGYRYPHNFEGGYVNQDYLPEKLKGRRYYRPSKRGFEEILAKRLAKLRSPSEED